MRSPSIRTGSLAAAAAEVAAKEAAVTTEQKTQSQRLDALRAHLDASEKELLARALVEADTPQGDVAAYDRVHDALKTSLGSLARRAKAAAEDLSEQQVAAAKFVLHERDEWWRKKLDTNRVAVGAQLREQARDLT
jgi:uncharacterized membrane protein YccC